MCAFFSNNSKTQTYSVYYHRRLRKLTHIQKCEDETRTSFDINDKFIIKIVADFFH